jgi:hypothetical protein
MEPPGIPPLTNFPFVGPAREFLRPAEKDFGEIAE